VSLVEVSQVLADRRIFLVSYPYISHMVFNAGVAPFSGMDWVALFKQGISDPMGAITAPKFYKQKWGERSLDGYGWVWQCNVFGHYYLVSFMFCSSGWMIHLTFIAQYKALSPMLTSNYYPFDARVIWTSSLEARRTYSSEDWQLKETKDPYGSSKYQAELIAAHLDRISLKTESSSDKRIRHFVAHPGVCHTDIARELIHPALQYIKLWVFYIVSLFFYILRWSHSLVSSFRRAVSSVRRIIQ
jgi:3-keto steroid reductase